jgi:uncharacterized membrane protein
MNAAYIHLILNHFPLILNVAAFVVILAGLAWRSEPVTRAALLLVVLAALLTVPTFITGDGAAKIVKGMQGVDAAAIRPHDDSAGYTLTVILIEGVAALASLIFFRGGRLMPRWAVATMLVLILIGSAAAGRTSFLGGKIHHPEGSSSQPR